MGAHTNHGVGYLGKRIRAERQRRKISVTQMYMRTGIHMTSLGAFENRGAIPQLHNLVKIAKALDCTLDWLVGCDDEESPFFTGGPDAPL